ncbi:DUF1365 domain-containing protein [Amphritea pacifica]|uniref:DUF1365 domain-containing protein n=1 Tax=Amphritea pacifica TaxID=2811233 RepID=A0ABS2W735_9GAMM|nr:DUF1365 domain-containing protein [Amphritea pacifica]MBN0987515.1 DUF1365 domain-containing protein [Amphritea pacifica]
MVKLNSSVFAGVVMHHRFTPKRHRFIYRVFSLCIDLDELTLLSNTLRWFSINRFGLLAFHEKDHGRGEGRLRQEITGLLSSRGYASATHRIELLCYPRILGYTFNPLSVYFCYNPDNELEVILYEVSNTFGQRHSYLLVNDKPDEKIVRHSCHKLMYVSPFMPMDTAYSFRILPPRERVSVCIQQSSRDGTQITPILNATFTGQRQEINDINLLRLFISHPLMTLKVMGAIHWEALRLWLKGLKLQPRNTTKSYSISWSDRNGETHYENL